MADWWFSPGPPVSSTNKTDHHDITDILLKVALNTIKLNKKQKTKTIKLYDMSGRTLTRHAIIMTINRVGNSQNNNLTPKFNYNSGNYVQAHGQSKDFRIYLIALRCEGVIIPQKIVAVVY